ncbi:MAG: tetratricopeptide repeat protein [Chloroflexi bacterium]|nr:tetratricopeptide repeat protein [Chloroflexota bacterium]
MTNDQARCGNWHLLRRVRRRHRPAVLFVLIVLAGCSGLPLPGAWPTPTPESPLVRFDRAIATAEAEGEAQARAAAYLARGDAWAGTGAYELAIDDYTRAIELDPANARIYNNRALAHQALGQIDAALDDLFTATELDPAYVRAYRNRVALLEQAGNDQRLLAGDYGRLAELEPASAGVYRYRQGVILHTLRDFAAARAAYDAALTAEPQQVDALYERALLSYAEGRLPDAIADLNRAIQLSPRATNAYYARGLARNAAGDQAGAIADLGQALALNPTYAEALLARAALLSARGDRAGAIADLDRLEQREISEDMRRAAAVLRRR